MVKQDDKKTVKSGQKTLLWSVLMSSPGPIVVGLGLLVGKSNTQLADFVRRSAELIAIIVAYIIYKVTNRDDRCDIQRKEQLERISNIIVGAMMCLGGTIMLVLALKSGQSEGGNVIPGLSIAVMGVIANSIFWHRYTKLNKEKRNEILRVQARLYRAKTVVDSCVTIALLSVAIMPGTDFAFYMDKIGSSVVAIYLIWSGVKTLWEKAHK